MRTREPASAQLGAQIARLEPDLVRLRRDLHRHPELGFKETRTASVVAERLQRLGLRVRTGVGTTGVLADLDGAQPGPTLLIRAELDGLPVSEATGLSYASDALGAMHACGHDAHMAAVIGAATLLADARDTFAGRVRFCFQPAEELLRGAEAVIADAAMAGVDQVLGAHLLSALPFGTVAAPRGEFLSGADFFEITVTGVAGHAGMPHCTVDPILAAAQLVSALQSIVARETKPGERLVVGIAAINGGAAANVAVEDVTLLGNLRWFEESQRKRALERIQAITAGVCQGLRTRHSFKVTGGAPVTANSGDQAALVAQAVAESGRARTVDVAPLNASDDFAYFLQHAPGAFIGIGAGGPEAPPHHHPAFMIDERAIALTAELLVRTTRKVLRPRD
jgi:amidohydrolase